MNLPQTVGNIGIGVELFGMAAFGFLCTYKIAPWKKVIEYPISTETVYYTKSGFKIHRRKKIDSGMRTLWIVKSIDMLEQGNL